MGWWGGRNTERVRDRIVGWGGYEKIVKMQEELLLGGGKKAILWQRRESGEKCLCMRGGLPQSPHSVCYGTGIVGGYRQINSREIYLYRDNNKIRVYSDEKGSEEYLIVGNSVETDWFDGRTEGGFVGSVEFVVYRGGGTVVEFSIDGIEWRGELELPVERFKIRLRDIDNVFEICRVRIKERKDNWMYFAENPPLRMEQLFRWGVDVQPFDVRVWTISDRVMLKTGDVIRWLEGYYEGLRYSIVNVRVTQFVRERDMKEPDRGSSNVLTQVVGARKIKSSEELFRLW